MQGYLDHLAVERGLSANTLSAYRRDLRRYTVFLADRDVTAIAAVAPTLVAILLVRFIVLACFPRTLVLGSSDAPGTGHFDRGTSGSALVR
ncbi:MAG: Site-specific tyrosine recombinase XerD [uncultured Friedmanniella sp.]|uniref:Site-specific tyrosine recombinase XerD n=1 Tax=uncultured Friedmanniella sp. TaxID=335381 RepID=A0A6J4LRD1_9ACTN|nr:site-specific integrase [uncultured Friedmanniella sp.]CAA9338909.1 MAG: Site-specific tyrosine recombinase XerD [uncultured Friedmanniella sp.]